ncbi:MAG TPA: hypothetical protein VIV65_06335 [Gemmatimonadaceae bacterium]|jgi:hypothetical protein
MARLTTIQLALLLIGLIVWGYGQRIDDPSLRMIGIAFFALATMLRFFRRSDTKRMEPPEPEGDEEP